MARWEDTAFLTTITKDPIDALIESQTDAIEEREIDLPEDWDSVYGDQEETIGQEIELTGSSDNPIDLDVDNLADPSTYNNRCSTNNNEITYSSYHSMVHKLKLLEEENACLLASKLQLEKRIVELENLNDESIPGFSNHSRFSKDHGNLSATVLIDGREVHVENLSPQMSGSDFTLKVSEAAGDHPGHMIVMQHSPIQLDLPLSQHGLGLRPFYAISLGHRRIEPGRSIKVQLLGRGPLI